MDMGGTSHGTSRTRQDAAPSPTAAPEAKRPNEPVNPVDVLRGTLKF